MTQAAHILRFAAKPGREEELMAVFARALAAAIPGASVRELEGSGHAAPFDAPTAFSALIAESVPSKPPAPVATLTRGRNGSARTLPRVSPLDPG